MAYVATRRRGRFEIRESLHTPAGPRARTLAGFRVLSDETLANAASRAQRPFDAAAVIASARRAGARVSASGAHAGTASRESMAASGTQADGTRRFVQASRRMASSLRHQPTSSGPAADAGRALIDLLGFADAVAASQPPRPREPLAFPVLTRLAA